MYFSMGQNQVSLIERCPLFRGSFFGGFTVYICTDGGLNLQGQKNIADARKTRIWEDLWMSKCQDLNFSVLPAFLMHQLRELRVLLKVPPLLYWLAQFSLS